MAGLIEDRSRGGRDKKGSAKGAYPPFCHTSTPPRPVTSCDMSHSVTLSRPAYVLRDLPGIADLEARLERAARHPNPLWAPEVDGLQDDVDALSLRLFGITSDDVVDVFDIEVPATPAEAPGWDATDGKGRVLRCWEYLGEQVVCVARGELGRTPDARSDEEIEADALAWGAALEAETRRFRRAG